MPEIAFDEIYENGVLKNRVQRVVSDTEIERRDAPTDIRNRLPVLRNWSNDAQDVAALTAMSAAQRLARQAVIEQRVAMLSRIVMRLIWQSGLDDGS